MKLRLFDQQQREDLVETIQEIQERLRRHPLPLWLFLALCFNIVLAQAVLATTTNTSVDAGNAYAIGLLGLVTAALGVYLLVVMLQPQRF